MRIKIQQFLFGASHSWSVVGKSIARSLIKNGHEVDLISTDGLNPKYIEEDLKQYIKPKPSGEYDMQMSYTAMHNFYHYFNNGKKNRYGIWNYEFDILQPELAKYINCVDMFLPSSKFFYDICAKHNFPKDKMLVLPHGIDWDVWANASLMPLNTEKKYKFLVNFGQPHIRKNISGTLEAWGRAFTKQDDVCLVIKAHIKKPDKSFEIDFNKTFTAFEKKYPNHGECLILSEYIPNIECLYKSCDALFMLPHAEAFFLPSLEMLASGGLVITSNYGGQLDFLNKQNSMLIDGKMIRAPREAQYWVASPYASMFEPDVNLAADALRHSYKNMEIIKEEKRLYITPELKEKFSWTNIAKTLEQLCL